MGDAGCGARLHIAQVEVVHGVAQQHVLQLAQVALLAVVRLRPICPPHVLLDPAAPLPPLSKPAGRSRTPVMYLTQQTVCQDEYSSAVAVRADWLPVKVFWTSARVVLSWYAQPCGHRKQVKCCII